VELDKQTSFKFAKFHAQIKHNQSDITEAQKWAKIALDSAEKDGMKINVDDLLFELSKSKFDKKWVAN
jgi:hypothetical protein